MDDGSTVLAVVLIGDPVGGEGGEGCKDGTSLPDGELTVSRGNDSNVRVGGCEFCDLFLQSIGETFVHGGTSGEDDVLAEVFSDIDIRTLDGFPCKLGEGSARLSVQFGLEEELGALHTDGAGNVDDLLVGEGELSVFLSASFGGGLLSFIILGNITELLFHFTDDFSLSGGGEGVSSIEEELLEVVGEDTSGDLHLLDGVRDRETFEDGHGMGDTISGIADETSGTSGGVEGEDGLDLDGAFLDLEGLEHNLKHLLSVVLGFWAPQ